MNQMLDQTTEVAEQPNLPQMGGEQPANEPLPAEQVPEPTSMALLGISAVAAS